MLNSMPMSRHLYDFAQKHITKRWYRNVEHTLAGENEYTTHLNLQKEYWGDITSARFFEFGVARDMFSNLLNYCHGMENQIAIDLNPYARRDLAQDIIRQLRSLDNPDFARVPEKDLGGDFVKDLKDFYGIDYRAPCDARTIDLADGSQDIICSTSTFEHIPPAEFQDILSKCFRLGHSGTIMTHQTDHSDHYAHGNPSITPYNFLKFSDKEWEKLYMPHYYTNRLRFSDIKSLVKNAGFEILHEIVFRPDNAEEMISSIKLDAKFQSYDMNDLTITRSFLVARRP